MLLGLLAAQLAPNVLLNMFDASEDMMGLGVKALRIISPHFLLAGIGVVNSGVFQALGQGIYSLLVSLIRQLVVLIPAAFLLSLSGDVNMVWWSFLISESVALAASIFFMTRANKKIIQPLYQHPEA